MNIFIWKYERLHIQVSTADHKATQFLTWNNNADHIDSTWHNNKIACKLQTTVQDIKLKSSMSSVLQLN